MAESLYTGITVQGLYSDQTGDQLFGATGTAVPASALYIAGKDTAGNLQPLALSTGGVLSVSSGNNTVTGAAWTSATAGGTFQYPNGTATQETAGFAQAANAILVQLDQTTTITAGAVTFQGSYDGTNWVTIPVAQILNANTFAQLSNPYTFVASTNQAFLVLLQGFQNIRLDLSTAITGTGSVTPFWTTIFGAPISASQVYAGSTAITATGSSLNVDVTNTVTVTGTVAVTQSTSPWVVAGNLTHNNAAPTANNVGALVAVASSAAPTYTAGDQVLLSTDLAGNLRTATTISGTTVVAGNLTNNNAAPVADNVGVLPAIAETAYATITYTTGNQVLPVTDLHGALNQDLQAWHGTELGNATNFGTTPGAVVVGQVNASIFQGTAAISVTNTLFEQISDGASAMGTMANWGTNPGAVKALNVNASVWGTLTNNNAAPAATNVGVLPALVEAGAFPATTLPALTAGNQALVSVTQGASLRVIPADEANAPSISYYGIDMGITQKSLANATVTPLISIQSNSAAIQFLIREIEGFSDGTLVWFQLIKNAQTLTGAAFTTTGTPSGSHIKVDTSATAITIGTGTVVWSGYAASKSALTQQLLVALAAGTPGDTYTIAAEKFGTGTSKVVARFFWSELAAAI